MNWTFKQEFKLYAASVGDVSVTVSSLALWAISRPVNERKFFLTAVTVTLAFQRNKCLLISFEVAIQTHNEITGEAYYDMDILHRKSLLRKSHRPVEIFLNSVENQANHL